MNSRPIGPRALVISGLSNSGKSTFCAWLAGTHGFGHVNCDQPSAIDRAGLRGVWDRVEKGDGQPLADALAGRADVVIDWSFPANDQRLEMIRALQKASIPAWWFHGEPKAARESCIKRGQRDIEDFDRQLQSVTAAEKVLRELYGPRFLVTLDSTHQRMAPEAIWQEIIDTEKRD